MDFNLEALVARVHAHRRAARARLGCSVQDLPDPQGTGAPPAGAESAPPVLDRQLSAITLFTHPIFPWRYFNHAIVCNWDDPAPGPLIRDITLRMRREGRVACFELEMPLSDGISPIQSPAWNEVARSWSANLESCDYREFDHLTLMARGIDPNSPGPEGKFETDLYETNGSSGEYQVCDMPAGELSRQIAVHRQGFQTGRGRALGMDKLLLQANLKAGVHYLWAMSNSHSSPVGSAAVLTAGSVAEIFALSVIPGHRGLGVGRLLARAAISHAAACGCSLVYLQTEADSSASSLYTRLAFVPLWRQTCYLHGG